MIEQTLLNTDDAAENSFFVCMMVLNHIYDTVQTHVSGGKFVVDLSVDL